MSLFSTGHDVVDQVGSVHLEGNILPTSWFSTFVLEMKTRFKRYRCAFRNRLLASTYSGA